MKKFKIIVLFAFLVSMIAGCTDNREKETEDKSIHVLENSLEELLTTSTNTKYGSNVENFRVVGLGEILLRNLSF
ncbi:hypothetical protein WJ0W_004823 [Paenibacillus melissococcoides]|uniref:Uncharacterized protein n=1 Tax=Paenibacillus melissococcoides TaxID=2912268 RepID=A0ABN8U8T1_9BACL|nr:MULTISPECIES: hypothetical protein [Paenibacillus]MEB9893019.1 hypothetical protein [Bacillus cereus]CAH8247574.1 hypothetical protein WJ0W_004823 [Paenibacillus melissococcoides]CAH8705391.1 hypothetical protein HTL2_000906 [Paenibacillus melissococcoides]CAH8714802.1 hypothetical protein WDD9_004026 [Paenibacillus melissococcoides]GIO79684.1 hypothetical protein J6TS7_32940 [Paenibacillus dendritiformis]